MKSFIDTTKMLLLCKQMTKKFYIFSKPTTKSTAICMYFTSFINLAIP